MLLASCKKDVQPDAGVSPFIGYWVNPVYSDTTVTYTRSTALPHDSYGFLLSDNYKFVEHKNVGSCGTPPIVYGIYEGSWTSIEDTLKVTVGYWGGVTTYKWLIVNIEKDKLVIHEIYSY
jgi:hypothetical protein